MIATLFNFLTSSTVIRMFPYIFFASFFLVYSVLGYVYLDSDFGWHLVYGQQILAGSIPRTDILSYTMTGYPVIDHEWLIEAGIAFLYPVVHELGLSMLFALIALSPLLMQRIIIRGNTLYILLLLEASSVINTIGIRAQLISWLFFSLLIVICNKKYWTKYKYFLPLLFLFWANMHGTFVIGIFVTGIFIAANFRSKLLLSDVGILLFSVLTTFINPYGLGLWQEVFRQFASSQLHTSIFEWIPTIFYVNIPIWIFFAFSTIFVSKYFTTFSLFEKLLFSFFFVFGLSAVRNVLYFFVVTTPMTITAITIFTRELKKIPYGIKRFHTALKVFSFLVVILCTFYLLLSAQAFISDLKLHNTTCPNEAIAYLQTHTPQGNIFSSYNWGGCLIWKLPQKKVFVDGRMPTWQWNASAHESSNAYQDYSQVVERKLPLATIDKKYHITTVLVPKELVQNQKPSAAQKLDTYLPKQLQFTLGTSQETLAPQLQQLGFKKVFDKEDIVIYSLN